MLFACALMLSAWTALAQKSISGTVLDETGVPLPGATVLIQGTSNGVTTDFDGNFNIQAAEGETLEVSFVGYSNQTLVVGAADSYSITLAPGNELEEVVVTSLGIKREAKAIGYAVQTVKSEDISNSGSNSAIDALAGKAAGVQITRSSGSAVVLVF